MKAVKVGLNVIAVVLLLSTAICGLWLRGQGASVEESSVDFHMMLGLASVVAGLAAAGVGIFGRTRRGSSPAGDAIAEEIRVSSPSDILVGNSSGKGR